MAAAGVDAAGRARACRAPPTRIPARLTVDPREGRDAALRREPAPARGALPAPGRGPADGPFASGGPPLQGKPLCYNNVLDALGRGRHRRAAARPGLRDRQAHEPMRRGRAGTLAAAWDDALAGGPRVSAFGGVVALTRPVDAAVAERAGVASSSRSSSPRRSTRRPWRSSRRSRTFASWWTRRWGRAARRAGPVGPDRMAPRRPAAPSWSPRRTPPPDDPATWRWPPGAPRPTRERRDLDLAWRLVRGVTSNAIVLVRDGMLIGHRLRARPAAWTPRGRRSPRRRRCSGADRSRRGLRLGRLLPVPGRGGGLPRGRGHGLRPARRLAPRRRRDRGGADAAGATMLLTGVRHFRH